MKLSKNSFLLVAFITLLSITLVACASEPDEADSSEKSGEKGGDLVIANSADAVSLDPAGSNDVPSSDIQANIFEALVKQDENLELQPGLAESWEAIDDTTWEFKLRKDVKFHDGSDFNADVVKA